MTEKVADYEKLLKDLMSRVPEADAKLIRSSLDRVRFRPDLFLVSMTENCAGGLRQRRYCNRPWNFGNAFCHSEH